MMDPGTIAILISAGSGVLGSLATAIAVLYRGKTAAEKLWGETWKSLYEAEKATHAQTRTDAAAESRASAQVLRDLADAQKAAVDGVRANAAALAALAESQTDIGAIVRALPRRRDDLDAEPGRRPRP